MSDRPIRPEYLMVVVKWPDMEEPQVINILDPTVDYKIEYGFGTYYDDYFIARHYHNGNISINLSAKGKRI
jgi:hypothetical protein